MALHRRLLAILCLVVFPPIAACAQTGLPDRYKDARPADLPLPSSLPPDDYETRLYAFLEDRNYQRLGWGVDVSVRDTGPYILGANYGTHPAVRIYYSPEIVLWLYGDRKTDIPDGAMIVKEMFAPPAAQYVEREAQYKKQFKDDPAKASATYEADLASSLEAWTVLVKDKSVSKDGWFWAGPAPGSAPDGYGYPFAFPASGAGLGTCLRCHASAEIESTFSTIKNLEGYKGEGGPLRFRVDESWRTDLPPQQRPAAGETENQLFAMAFNPHLPESMRPQPPAPPEALSMPAEQFLATFPPVRTVQRDGKQVTANLLPQSLGHVLAFPGQWADRVPAAPGGAEQFITSDNCLGCHGGLGGAPYGITMFIKTGPNYGDGYNISEFGEWRWSPMGLAGRDPIFYAQLESEFAILDNDGTPQVKGPLGTKCLSCHGAMGQRQLEIDAHADPDGGLDGETFRLEYTQLTTPLTLAEQEAQKKAGLFKYHKYGNLAREGISCTVCHHIAPPEPDPDHPDYDALELFLMHSTTGVFPYTPADELGGPYDDVKPKPMQHALGITPKGDPYIQDSRLCGTCHAINLPNLGWPTDKPLPGLTAEAQAVLNQAGKNGAAFLKKEVGVTWPEALTEFQHSIEQATFLEWQNSDFLDQSCQDCHMPGGFRSADGSVDIEQVSTQIASIQDSTYPEAENELPGTDITIPVRDTYRRHELVGLNVFMVKMFDQFDRILGIDKTDYMTGASNGDQLAIDNMLRQAREETVAVDVAITGVGDASLEANVDVTNKVGHRFPSGVGFRRAFLEVLVVRTVDGREEIVWGSGRTNSVGVIVDGNGVPLKTEFLNQKGPDGNYLYQPHHPVVTSEDQVQIYEELVQNADREFTTSFVHRIYHPKDNRLIPFGWLKPGSPAFNAKFGNSEVVTAFMEATVPEGGAATDQDFGPGRDSVTYKMDLPWGLDPRNLTVRATMYYQSIPPYWLHQRFSLAPDGPATQRLYYITSHLNTAGTAIEDWKLKLVSAEASVARYLGAQ